MFLKHSPLATPRSRFPVLALGLLMGLSAVFAACAASERQRPVNTSPIASGPGTVEQARQTLQGKWTLVSLDVVGPDGRKASVEAAGTLESDSFGNLNIEYRMSDAGIKALNGIGITPPNPVISTTGMAVIDPAQRKITYVPPDASSRAFDPKLAAARANPFALERPRYYALSLEGVLTLATRYDDGTDAVTSRWRK
jgi:hypothetical protein